MPFLPRTRRVVAGAVRLAGAALRGGVALISAALDLGLRLVSGLSDRLDARWSALARESRARRAGPGR